MTKLYNHNLLKERRKNLRNQSTEEEIILTYTLKKHFKTARFRRQYSIGPYILDFYSPMHRIAIELDGNHHLNQKEYDMERDNFIKSKNITVLRFWNTQVREKLPEVTAKIRNIILVCKT